MSFSTAIIRKECMEDIVSSRGGILYVCAALVLSIMGILLIGNTELSLLDNAQAVYMMAGVVMAIGGLIAVIQGGDGFAGERDRETLEALLVSPATGTSLAIAKLAGILLSWLILFLIALPYLWAVGSAGQNLVQAFIYLLLAETLLVTIYGGLMLILSARIKSFKGVLSIGFVIFLLSAIPLVLGPSLRQSTIGRILDWLNPMAVALNMIDSVVIDSQGGMHQILPLLVLAGYTAVSIWLMSLTTKRIEL